MLLFRDDNLLQGTHSVVRKSLKEPSKWGKVLIMGSWHDMESSKKVLHEKCT